MSFCSNCGTQVPEQSRFCPKCGQTLTSSHRSAHSETNVSNHAVTPSVTSTVQHSAPKAPNPYENEPCPDNHMTKAILALLFGGVFGIIALIKANEVESLWYSKQYVRAIKAANEANKWANIGFLVSGVLIGLYIVFVIFAAIMGAFL